MLVILAADILQSVSALTAMFFFIRDAFKNEKSRWGLANKVVGAIGFGSFFVADAAVKLVPYYSGGGEAVDLAKLTGLGVVSLAALSHLIQKLSQCCISANTEVDVSAEADLIDPTCCPRAGVNFF